MKGIGYFLVMMFGVLCTPVFLYLGFFNQTFYDFVNVDYIIPFYIVLGIVSGYSYIKLDSRLSNGSETDGL